MAAAVVAAGLLAATLARLEHRLGVIESDLDCDKDGSIADWLADLHDKVADVESRIDEFVLKPARDAA